MHFNISSVDIRVLNDGTNFWDIQGFSRDNTKTIFRTVIHQGKLSDLVSDNSKFHEGNALVVVSQNEAYNIDLTFYDSDDAWDSMNDGEYCNADTLNYFDKGYYVGLPVVVFCTWKGMLTTDI
jgi:hypothetical protein